MSYIDYSNFSASLYSQKQCNSFALSRILTSLALTCYSLNLSRSDLKKM